MNNLLQANENSIEQYFAAQQSGHNVGTKILFNTDSNNLEQVNTYANTYANTYKYLCFRYDY